MNKNIRFQDCCDFLKLFNSGVTSLTIQSLIALTLVALTSNGINLHQKPFLLHCLDESSPLLNTTDGVTFCDFDDLDATWPNCISDPTKHGNLFDFAEALNQLEQASIKFNIKIKAEDISRFQNLEIQNLDKMRATRLEVEKQLSNLGYQRLPVQVE